MDSDSAAKNGTGSALILIAHDDFGQAAIEALGARAASGERMVALRCRSAAHGINMFDWLQFESDGRWTPVASCSQEDCGRTVVLLVRDALEHAIYTRADIFLLTAIAAQESNLLAGLAGAVRRLRLVIWNPDLACAVVATHLQTGDASINDTPASLALRSAVDTLLHHNSFDYVFLEESFQSQPRQMMEQSPGKTQRSAVAAAHTILTLTYNPLSQVVRKELNSAQLDSARRVVALGLAEMSVSDQAIRAHLRSHIARRLARMVLRRNETLGGTIDTQTSANLEEQIRSVPWELNKLSLLLAKHHQLLAKEEGELLRDLIRGAGAAAHAMSLRYAEGRQRSPGEAFAPTPARPPTERRAPRSRWGWPLMWGVSVSIVLLGFSAFVALNLTLLSPAGLSVLLASGALLFVSLWLAVNGQRRKLDAPQPQPEPRFRPEQRYDSPLDKYRSNQEALRRIRLSKSKAATWKSNFEVSIRALTMLSRGESFAEQFAAGLPDTVCKRLLDQLGVTEEMLRSGLSAESRPIGSFLVSSDTQAVVQAISECGDQLVRGISMLGWQSLAAALLAGAFDQELQDTWLGHTVSHMHRASVPAAKPANVATNAILGVPRNTPENLIEKLLTVAPQAFKVILIDVNTLMYVQVAEAIQISGVERDVSPV